MGQIARDRAFLLALGKRLRAARRRRGMTQLQLSERARKSPRFIVYLEQGQRNPTLLVLKDLARALGIPQAGLLRWLR